MCAYCASLRYFQSVYRRESSARMLKNLTFPRHSKVCEVVKRLGAQSPSLLNGLFKMTRTLTPPTVLPFLLSYLLESCNSSLSEPTICPTWPYASHFYSEQVSYHQTFLCLQTALVFSNAMTVKRAATLVLVMDEVHNDGLLSHTLTHTHILT